MKIDSIQRNRVVLDSNVRPSDLICAQNGCFLYEYSKFRVRFLGEIIIMWCYAWRNYLSIHYHCIWLCFPTPNCWLEAKTYKSKKKDSSVSLWFWVVSWYDLIDNCYVARTFNIKSCEPTSFWAVHQVTGGHTWHGFGTGSTQPREYNWGATWKKK
jgi:hypothetical protein